ncbi:MAG: hydrogenase [Roseateles depolymerans]|uniref:Hydrogenase expression/formation protein n=1 Tax=Roseateles depolymerans TaxID=76731 RepID=A0A2W5DKH4_9BURK|nr:MAG: hydrogenase [Roseateles depolymerans]
MTTSSPPPAAAHHPLLARLAALPDARWVDADSLPDFLALQGAQVLVLAGDPVQFPEGLDVAVVLPELRRHLGASFGIGVVPRAAEAAVAARFGSQRWPSLLFFTDGQYQTVLPGMHDWTVYLDKLRAALAAPVSRPPSVGIAVVSATGTGACA